VPDVTLVNPTSLSPPVGFSHAATAEGWIFIGGQIASDSSGAVICPGDMAAQFRRALANLLTAVQEAGGRSSGIVKMTYYVTDVAAYRAALKPIGEAYRQILGKHYPAASLFEVKGLFEPAAMIEIECVARREEESIGGG
jgi:enamine deaminase RidA (YjgF/YER057c/UK114 family)